MPPTGGQLEPFKQLIHYWFIILDWDATRVRHALRQQYPHLQHVNRTGQFPSAETVRRAIKSWSIEKKKLYLRNISDELRDSVAEYYFWGLSDKRILEYLTEDNLAWAITSRM